MQRLLPRSRQLARRSHSRPLVHPRPPLGKLDWACFHQGIACTEPLFFCVSKKQKLSGGSADQSIEQLIDVTVLVASTSGYARQDECSLFSV